MDKVINWELIKNPYNWVIVFLILYFVALLARIVMTAAEGGGPISFPQVSIGGA
jgi:hypothetical protein